MDSSSTSVNNINRQNILLELNIYSKTLLVDIIVSVDGKEKNDSWELVWGAQYISNINNICATYSLSLSGKQKNNFKYGQSFYKIEIRNASGGLVAQETSDLVAPDYNQFAFTKTGDIQRESTSTIMVSILLQSYTDCPPRSAFKRMLDSRNLTDVVIKTKSGNFPCHKVVLAAASEYFERMFSTDLKEKKESVVDWEGVFEADVVRDFLDFVYTGHTPSNSANTFMELMKVAHMCLMDRLRNLCVRQLKETITVENMGEVLRFAAKYEAAELQKDVINFVVEHWDSNDPSAAPWDTLESEFTKNLSANIIKTLVAKKMFL